MKKIFTGILSLLLILSLILPCSAEAGAFGDPLRLVDDADLLTDEEEEFLLARLDKLSLTYECDIVIVTENELFTGSAQSDADDYYDQNGYGCGADYSGILLLVSMDDRDWALSTCGFGIVAFPDEVQERLMDNTLPYLSEGDYSRAFNVFAVLAGEQLESARSEDYITPEIVDSEDEDFMYGGGKAAFDVKSNLIFALIVGLLTGWITTSVMKGRLKSVRGQVSASRYVVPGSFGLTDSRDLFLYHTVKRTPRESGSSGSRPGGHGGSGGHSTVHTSSSGHSHGGSSGKF